MLFSWDIAEKKLSSFQSGKKSHHISNRIVFWLTVPPSQMAFGYLSDFVKFRNSSGKNICESTLREKCKCQCCHWAGSKISDNVQDSQEKIIREIVMGLFIHWDLIPKWSGRTQECSKYQSEGRSVSTKAYYKLMEYVGMVERFKST